MDLKKMRRKAGNNARASRVCASRTAGTIVWDGAVGPSKE